MYLKRIDNMKFLDIEMTFVQMSFREGLKGRDELSNGLGGADGFFSRLRADNSAFVDIEMTLVQEDVVS